MRAYLSDVHQFAGWSTPHTDEVFAFEAVTDYDIRAWRDVLAASARPAIVNRKLAVLSTLFRWAIESRPGAGATIVAQVPVEAAR